MDVFRVLPRHLRRVIYAKTAVRQASLPWIPSRCFATEPSQPGRPSDGGLVMIDRSGLMGANSANPRLHTRVADLRSFEPATSLCDLIKGMIQSRGPVSVAEFMKLCLSHPVLGYYMHKEHAVFGTAGDFITSPEISQMFGELVALWLISSWQQLGCPPSVALIECGPGRGTLMADILRVARKISPFAAAVSRVDLVETSAALRRVQAATLSVGSLVDCEPAGAGGAFAGRLSHGVIDSHGALPGVRVVWHDRIDETGSDSGRSTHAAAMSALAPAATTAASSTSASADAGSGTPAAPPVALVVAHELFDALPVHQLEWVPPQGHRHADGHGQGQGQSSTSTGTGMSGSRGVASAGDSAGAAVPLSGPGMWRERLVDVDPDAPAEAPAAAVAAASSLAAAAAAGTAAVAAVSAADQRQHFVVVTAPAPTPASAAFSALIDSLHRRATASGASSIDSGSSITAAGSTSAASSPPAASPSSSPAAGQAAGHDAGAGVTAVTDEMLMAFLRAEQEALAAKAKPKAEAESETKAVDATVGAMSSTATGSISASAGNSGASGTAAPTLPGAVAVEAAPAATASPSPSPTHLRYGTVAEYCPSAAVVAAALAKRLSLAGGAALVVDYGYSHRAPLAGGGSAAGEAQHAAEGCTSADRSASAGSSASTEASSIPRAPARSAAEYLAPLPPLPAELRASVRAIRRHAFVPLTSMPGEADLSADVDFDALARVALEALAPASAAADGDAAHPFVNRKRGHPTASTPSASASISSPLAVAGPVTQRDFLLQMGIGTRLSRLQQTLEQRQAAAEAAGDTATVASCKEHQARLQREAERLVYEMGGVYKFLALLHPPPSDCGGDIVTVEAAAWKIASSVPGFA